MYVHFWIIDIIHCSIWYKLTKAACTVTGESNCIVQFKLNRGWSKDQWCASSKSRLSVIIILFSKLVSSNNINIVITIVMKQQILFRLAIVKILFHVNFSQDLLDREALLYVTPSSGIPCPTKPCITLSHFAQTVSNWLSSNTTLIFLNGNHKLDLDLFISNISNFSMLTNSTSESEGPAYTICCHHQMSLKFENVTKLWIKGIYFIGYGNNSFTSVSNFMISNSTFQGQNGSRTAMKSEHHRK